MGTSTRQRKHYGPRGKGDIRTMKSGEVRCYIEEKGHREMYPIAAEDAPEAVGSWKFQDITNVSIELSEDETEIRNVRPWDGTFYLVFDRFAGREDQPPTIKHKEAERVTIPATGASWVNPPHEEFYPILRIVGGTKYDGMEFVKPLVYMFEEDVTNPGKMEIVYDRKFWYAQLINFLTVTGFDFDADSLARSENVLVQLQDILKERDTVFQGTVNNGWLERELDHVPEGAVVKR